MARCPARPVERNCTADGLEPGPDEPATRACAAFQLIAISRSIGKLLAVWAVQLFERRNTSMARENFTISFNRSSKNWAGYFFSLTPAPPSLVSPAPRTDRPLVGPIGFWSPTTEPSLPGICLSRWPVAQALAVPLSHHRFHIPRYESSRWRVKPAPSQKGESVRRLRKLAWKAVRRFWSAASSAARAT